MSTGREVPTGISPTPGPEVVSAHPTPNKNGQHHPSNSSPITPPALRNPSQNLCIPLSTQQNPRMERSRTTGHSHPSIWYLHSSRPHSSSPEPPSTQNPHAVHVQPSTASGTGGTEPPPAPAWLPGTLRPVHSGPTHRGRAHSTALNPSLALQVVPVHATAPVQSTQHTHTATHRLAPRIGALARSHCALSHTRVSATRDRMRIGAVLCCVQILVPD